MITSGVDKVAVVVGIGVSVGFGISVGNGVSVGLGVFVVVGSGVCVRVGVSVGVAVLVGVGVTVGVGVGVYVGSTPIARSVLSTIAKAVNMTQQDTSVPTQPKITLFLLDRLLVRSRSLTSALLLSAIYSDSIITDLR